MLKALYRKQFLELSKTYFINRKTGEALDARKKAGRVVLFVALFLCVACAFMGVSDSFAQVLVPLGLDWLYFSLLGLFALVASAIGSVLMTYSSLFRAKDNDLLLSMPIPPYMIVIVRMTGVVITSFLFALLAWGPTLIQFWLVKGSQSIPVGAGSVVLGVALLVFITLIGAAVACLIGWIVALLANRIKNKGIVTTILLVLFLIAYYYVCFQATMLFEQIVARLDQIADIFQEWAWLIYQLGLGATGNIGGFLLFGLVACVLFVIAYIGISKSFFRIAAGKVSERKKVAYASSSVKASKVEKSLFERELKRFLHTTAYLVNCSLGIILPVIGIVAAVMFFPVLRETALEITTEIPQAAALIPIAVVVLGCVLASMTTITCCSVSLEGRTLWIIQSLPVPLEKVLSAKLKLHVYLAGIPNVLLAVVAGYALQFDAVTIVLCGAVLWMFVNAGAALGLLLDLRNPNFTWTNIVVPIKQSMNVVITMFGGWAVAIAFGALYFFFGNALGVDVCLVIFIVVLAAAVMLLRRRIFAFSSI